MRSCGPFPLSLAVLLSGPALAGLNVRSFGFPEIVLERHGYWGTAPNDTCCEVRMVGWGPKGEPVVASSSWDQDQEAFRFSVEIHDPLKDQPEVILSESSFRDDESLPFGCKEGEDALGCFWRAREPRIRTALSRLKVSPTKGLRMVGLPPYEVDWVSRPSEGMPPMAFDVGVDGIRFHLPDTSLPGLHLLPLGMIHSSSPHSRWLVMRLDSWDRWDDGPIERGVRFLRLPEAERPMRTKR